MSERNTGQGQSSTPRPGPRPGTDDVRVASRAHLFGLSNLVVWPLGMVGTLVIYLVRGRRSPYVREQAAQALNFWLTLSLVIIGLVGSLVTMFIAPLIIPLFVFLVVWGYGLVMGLIGAVAARSGKSFRYPLTAGIF
ncbi:DUF4870 domain-containing protein [Microbispora bryophytorum]|uniref:DUF4870 domain-containing protein n=1 Tax=Microbispora bryophytorum TaxID=1460882 RepID=UPI00340AF680